MGNRTFFKEAKEGRMSLGDIFSDVTRKHTQEEVDKVFIGGTKFTTPSEAEMLSGWTKPFLFARFFCICLLGGFVLWFLRSSLQYVGASYILMTMIPFVVPVSMLLLIWEMHIPRNISLMEVIKMVAIGGILSIFVAIVGFRGVGDVDAIWAGLIEEPAKLLIICYFLKKKNRYYILDGVLIGVAVGTGFAAFESLIYTWSYYSAYGEEMGIYVALIRAFTAICGHGLYAGLYGGGLLMAKQREEFQIRHLLSFDFLKYFGLAILLHMYNNIGIDLGLPTFFGGLLTCEMILEAGIAICVLMPMLRNGVNQIVVICMKQNGGRVTQAVNRAESNPIIKSTEEKGNNLINPTADRGDIVLEGIAGPAVGQIYKITERPLTIGRTPGQNDVALPNCKNVSSMHCEVFKDGGRIMVKDLNSTNGTFIGDQRLTPHVPMSVQSGQCIYLGNKTCGFRVAKK